MVGGSVVLDIVVVDGARVVLGAVVLRAVVLGGAVVGGRVVLGAVVLGGRVVLGGVDVLGATVVLVGGIVVVVTKLVLVVLVNGVRGARARWWLPLEGPSELGGGGEAEMAPLSTALPTPSDTRTVATRPRPRNSLAGRRRRRCAGRGGRCRTGGSPLATREKGTGPRPTPGARSAVPGDRNASKRRCRDARMLSWARGVAHNRRKELG